MHASSYASMERFTRDYVEPLARRLQRPLRILEVGSRNVNGSYRPIFEGQEFTASYTGIDVAAGAGVDIVINSRNNWSVDFIFNSDQQLHQFDAIICGQVLEHDDRWWDTLKQIRKIAATGGLACVIAPGAGLIDGESSQHNPPDYYRFMPDAPKVWAELLNADLLESWWDESSPWCDCGGIFRMKG